MSDIYSVAVNLISNACLYNDDNIIDGDTHQQHHPYIELASLISTSMGIEALIKCTMATSMLTDFISLMDKFIHGTSDAYFNDDIAACILRVLGALMHRRAFFTALKPPSTIDALFDMLLRLLELTLCCNKTVIVHALWCLSVQDAPADVIMGIIRRAVFSIHGVLNRVSSPTVEHEALEALLHFYRQVPTTMIEEDVADTWMRIAVVRLCRNNVHVRGRATVILEEGIESALIATPTLLGRQSTDASVNFVYMCTDIIVPWLSSAVMEPLPDVKLEPEQHGRIVDRQRIAFRVWSLLVRLLRPHLLTLPIFRNFATPTDESRYPPSLCNNLMILAYRGFRSNDDGVRIAALYAHIHFADALFGNYSLDTCELSVASNRWKMILWKPIFRQLQSSSFVSLSKDLQGAIVRTALHLLTLLTEATLKRSIFSGGISEWEMREISDNIVAPLLKACFEHSDSHMMREGLETLFCIVRLAHDACGNHSPSCAPSAQAIAAKASLKPWVLKQLEQWVDRFSCVVQILLSDIAVDPSQASLFISSFKMEDSSNNDVDEIINDYESSTFNSQSYDSAADLLDTTLNLRFDLWCKGKYWESSVFVLRQNDNENSRCVPTFFENIVEENSALKHRIFVSVVEKMWCMIINIVSVCTYNDDKDNVAIGLAVLFRCMNKISTYSSLSEVHVVLVCHFLCLICEKVPSLLARSHVKLSEIARKKENCSAISAEKPLAIDVVCDTLLYMLSYTSCLFADVTSSGVGSDDVPAGVWPVFASAWDRISHAAFGSIGDDPTSPLTPPFALRRIQWQCHCLTHYAVIALVDKENDPIAVNAVLHICLLVWIMLVRRMSACLADTNTVDQCLSTLPHHIGMQRYRPELNAVNAVLVLPARLFAAVKIDFVLSDAPYPLLPQTTPPQRRVYDRVTRAWTDLYSTYSRICAFNHGPNIATGTFCTLLLAQPWFSSNVEKGLVGGCLVTEFLLRVIPDVVRGFTSPTKSDLYFKSDALTEDSAAFFDVISTLLCLVFRTNARHQATNFFVEGALKPLFSSHRTLIDYFLPKLSSNLAIFILPITSASPTCCTSWRGLQSRVASDLLHTIFNNVATLPLKRRNPKETLRLLSAGLHSSSERVRVATATSWLNAYQYIGDPLAYLPQKIAIALRKVFKSHGELAPFDNGNVATSLPCSPIQRRHHVNDCVESYQSNSAADESSDDVSSLDALGNPPPLRHGHHKQFLYSRCTRADQAKISMGVSGIQAKSPVPVSESVLYKKREYGKMLDSDIPSENKRAKSSATPESSMESLSSFGSTNTDDEVVSCIPSTLVLSSPSILKKKSLPQNIVESGVKSTTGFRRVKFNLSFNCEHTFVAEELIDENHTLTSVALNRDNIMSSECHIDDSEVADLELSTISSKAAFFPELVGSTMSVDAIRTRLPRSRALRHILRALSVHTVGDFCSLSVAEVSALPFPRPVQTATSVLRAHLKRQNEN